MTASSASPSASATSPQAPATGMPAARQPLTKEQRDAIFAATAATMQPARAPAASELLDWKPQIMEYYGKGFSAAQIRDMLHAANVTTSERVVQRFVAKYSHHRKRAAAPSKAQPSDTTAVIPVHGNSDLPAASEAAPSATSAPSARQGPAKISSAAATAKRN